MFDYGEACPVSKAASILCERWTLQIVREMLMGASRFSELQQFLPKMSPTLLNSRLKSLEQLGILIKTKTPEKRTYQYFLTPTGQALQGVIGEMGKWGMAWAFESIKPEELNAANIVRDFAVGLRTDNIPSPNFTAQINVLVEGESLQHFIMLRDGKTQTCDEATGYDVDVYLTASLETLGKIWFGHTSLANALESKLLKVAGHQYYVNNLSKWLGLSQFNCNASHTRSKTNTA